jgi:anti-sigma-K factor RskA
MERTHEELKELIAPYVLGAVDEEEAAVIRSHVLSCEECMTLAEELSDAATALAVSVDPVPVPAGFEDAVVARVREGTPQETARRRGFWSRLSPALAAAALLIATVVLAVSLFNTRDQLAEERQAIKALVSSDQGMQLTGDEGRGRMVPTDGGGVFAAAGLEDPPDGHIYQVWLMDDACVDGSPDCKPVSAGTFEPDDGIGLLEVDKSLEGTAAVAVTIEEGNGSESGPTTDPVLSSI